MDWDGRKIYLLGALVIIAIVAAGVLIENASLTVGSGGMESIDASGSAWFETELQEVDSGANFSIADIDSHVAVQTFAVWCHVCKNQQEERGDLLPMRDDVELVSLNVDLNENSAVISEYKSRNGFNWKHAVSPPNVTEALISDFGQSIVNIPSASVVIVCKGGEAHGPFNGVQTAEELSQEIDTRCV